MSSKPGIACLVCYSLVTRLIGDPGPCSIARRGEFAPYASLLRRISGRTRPTSASAPDTAGGPGARACGREENVRALPLNERNSALQTETTGSNPCLKGTVWRFIQQIIHLPDIAALRLRRVSGVGCSRAPRRTCANRSACGATALPSSGAAFGLDEGESLGGLLSQGPPTPALEHQFVDNEGFVWLTEDAFVNYFENGVDPVKAKVMYATQQPLAGSAFNDEMGVPAWKSLPSWYLVAQDDEALPPDAQRMFANRMGATTAEVPSGHLAMISHPADVVKLTETGSRSRTHRGRGQLNPTSTPRPAPPPGPGRPGRTSPPSRRSVAIERPLGDVAARPSQHSDQRQMRKGLREVHQVPAAVNGPRWPRH